MQKGQQPGSRNLPLHHSSGGGVGGPSNRACVLTMHSLFEAFRTFMSAPGSGEGAAVLAQALAAYGCRHVFGVVSVPSARAAFSYRPNILRHRSVFLSWNAAWHSKLLASIT
jgi:hypothetical protein